MTTNLALDDRLIKHALKLSGKKTKKEAVNEALEEYIRKREQMKIFELAGKIEYHSGYVARPKPPRLRK